MDVEGLALEVEGGGALEVGGLAVGLPGAEVEALLGGGGGLAPVDLADAEAGAVVDAVGDAAALVVGALEAVLGVPGEAAGDRGHRGHAAVDVVGVGGAVGLGVVGVVAGEAGLEEAVAVLGVIIPAVSYRDVRQRHRWWRINVDVGILDGMRSLLSNCAHRGYLLQCPRTKSDGECRERPF